MKNTFDVIIVGAGPAGTAAAIVLARAGVDVALVDRGEFPGSKNVMGGQIYSMSTSSIIPEFWKDIPMERPVAEKQVWLLSKDSKTSIAHKSPKLAMPPYNSFTVLRAKFDKWFVGKAKELGVTYIPETLVEDVIRENNKIIGVRTGREDGILYSKIVVAADGVNSLLAKKIGLHNEIKPENVALAVKEIIALPANRIQDIFGLDREQGMTIEIVGEITHGMVGTGFIYTNKDSLSIGVGCVLSDFVKYGLSAYDLIEELKNHPVVAPLLDGGQIREYMAHLIPEGGYKAMPTLYADNFLVVGDAGMLVNGLFQEGSNLAMASGRLAAETIIEALKRNDLSSEMLSLYKKKLDESFVVKDLKHFKNAFGFLEGHRHFFTTYAEMINTAATEFLMVDEKPKRTRIKEIIKSMLKKRNIFGLIKDMFDGWRAFR